jgi:hypothetical protein
MTADDEDRSFLMQTTVRPLRDASHDHLLSHKTVDQETLIL